MRKRIFRYILYLISLIYGEETETTQLVSLYSNAAIIQEGLAEMKIFLKKPWYITAHCYTLNNSVAPLLVGSFLFEIMTIIEYSIHKFSSFYEVFYFREILTSVDSKINY